MKFVRITVNPQQMGGVPCIRGLRIPVATVIEMVADGMTPKEILEAFPDLEAADLDEALHSPPMRFANANCRSLLLREVPC